MRVKFIRLSEIEPDLVRETKAQFTRASFYVSGVEVPQVRCDTQRRVCGCGKTSCKQTCVARSPFPHLSRGKSGFTSHHVTQHDADRCEARAAVPVWKRESVVGDLARACDTHINDARVNRA
ncbi:hypothetical protein Bbelb_362650 [Branchiostoma belcheri]|nr:hypothetical protein Bbelb_362650 [Branchiostoma belcheri]